MPPPGSLSPASSLPGPGLSPRASSLALRWAACGRARRDRRRGRAVPSGCSRAATGAHVGLAAAGRRGGAGQAQEIDDGRLDVAAGGEAQGPLRLLAVGDTEVAEEV